MEFDWSPYGRHTPMFSWAGQTKQARLVAVFDGDTCRVVFDTGVGMRQVIVRVNGIDSPEMHSKDEDEKRHAISARNQFLELVAPGVFRRDGDYDQKGIVQKLADHVTLVTLELGEADKYGRVLAKVLSRDGTDVGQRLIDSGAAHPYFGKTKEGWHWLRE